MPNPLPVHPRTGLTALGFGKRGPIWPALGGAPDPDGDNAGGGDDGGGKGPGSSTDDGGGSADKGFPSNTRWQDMDPEQQVAYWMHQSRKHEGTVKGLGDINALKAAAAELEQIKQARKTEQQKLQERAETAEKKAAEAELRMLKREIAEEQGIPLAQADRLRGTTREEIEADAADFAPFVKSDKDKGKGQGTGRGPDLDQGAGNGSPPKASESSGRALYEQRKTQPTVNFS